MVAQAGLRFTKKDGAKEGATAESALRDLQNDIDAARQPLLYIENGGEGRWMLCVGYDSERGEVYLQDQGAQFNTDRRRKFRPACGKPKASSATRSPC